MNILTLLFLIFTVSGSALHRQHRDLIGYNRLLNNVYYGHGKAYISPKFNYMSQIMGSSSISRATKTRMMKYLRSQKNF